MHNLGLYFTAAINNIRKYIKIMRPDLFGIIFKIAEKIPIPDNTVFNYFGHTGSNFTFRKGFKSI